MQKMSFLVYRMKRGLGGRRDCDSAVSPRRPDAVAAAVFSALHRQDREPVWHGADAVPAAIPAIPLQVGCRAVNGR